MTLIGRASQSILELAFPPAKYGQKTVDEMYRVMRRMTLKSIWRAYDSTDNYSMPMQFSKIKTDIWYWYGLEEKNERILDLQYVKSTFRAFVFAEFRA